MQCRYCGREVKPIGTGLTTSYGPQCNPSPTKKHLCLSDGIHCVYCGRETRTMGGQLTTSYGQRCHQSPTGKHVLQ